MPAGIAAIDRLAAIVASRATVAHGLLGEHGRSEPERESRPPDVVVRAETTQPVPPSPDLRA
jgi:D-lactate dehydrogenase (cytochrome)